MFKLTLLTKEEQKEIIQNIINKKDYHKLKNIYLTPKQKNKLFSHNNYWIKIALANRKDLTKKQIDMLINDEQKMVRYMVAQREDLTLEQTDKLNKDLSSMVQIRMISTKLNKEEQI